MTLRFRLTAWYALVLLAAFGVTAAGLRLALSRSIDATVDRELHVKLAAMRDFIDHLRTDPTAGPLIDELAEEDALTPGGEQFRLATAGGSWLYQSAAARAWDQAAPRRGAERIDVIRVNGKRRRVLTAPLYEWVVQIGAPMDSYDSTLAGLTATLLLATPLVLLLASAGGYWMSGRALSPVARIAHTADAIQAHDLSRRLPVRNTGDEIDHLSSTLNAMFERLEAGFARMRQFTADASHELRTPVAIIRTTAELARSRPRTAAEYERAMEQIQSAAERASRLIEDLMTLVRGDAGAAPPIREPVDPAGLLADVIAEVRPASLVPIQLCPPLPSCAVNADPEALRRLVLILLDNAVKYNRPGGGVRVSLRREEAAVCLEVADTGRGIGAEHLPHIFERFYRAEPDRSRATGGAGLGLAIARQIARQHGGEIGVASEVNVGSVFTVRLPLS